MTSKENTKSFREFLIKKILPVFITFLSLFIVAAVGLPLCIYYHKDIILYIVSAIIAIGVGVAIFFLVRFILAYSKDLSSSLDSLDKQFDDFSKGEVRLSNSAHNVPLANAIQSQLNSVIVSYSKYRLTYNAATSDAIIKEKIKNGHIFSLSEFKDSLFNEVQSNLNFRSSLLYIEAQGGEKIPDKVMESLHNKILEVFPDALVGQYDEKTYVVYVYSVGSFLSLETLAENFVTSFNKLVVSSFDDVSNIYYCRIGGVVYPYTPITNLMEDGFTALKNSKDVSINVGVRSAYYPHAIVSETSRRVIYLASIESFEDDFRKANTFALQVDALKRFVRWFSITSGFEVGGVYRYGSDTGDYKLLLEVGKDEKDRSFSRLGATLSPATLDPFYDASMKDLSFCASDASEMPLSLAAPLNNLGIKSFFFFAICYGGEKRGLLYLTSNKDKAYFPLITRENLNSFASSISSLVVELGCRAEQSSKDRVLEALANRTSKYVYTIDRETHRLTYVSENLHRCFPKAIPGAICYQVLRTDHKAPCFKCPLVHGVDHRVISHISATESSISVLEFRGMEDNESTILIEQSSVGSVSMAPSRLLDEMLLIKNIQALSLDVSHEIKMGSVGEVVSVRLLDAENILARLPGADSNSLMAAICKTVQDGGYGDLMYRYSTFEIAFLLRSYTKPKIMGFVEEITSLLSGTIEVKDTSFLPKYAFSAIAYPTEASSSKGLVTLIKSELDRSEKYGDGFLVEVDNKHPRKASRGEYVKDVLEATLAKNEMPINIQPVVNSFTGATVEADILFRLYGLNGEPIAPSEFIPLAAESAQLPSVDLGTLRAAGELYDHYAFTIFKTLGIKGLGVYASPESVKDPTFPSKVEEIFARYKFPKGYIVFQVLADDLEKLKDTLPAFMDKLAPLGVIFEATNYNPNRVPLDLLKELKITRLKTDRRMLNDAASNPNDYSALSRFVDSANRAGFSLTAFGIENEEMKDIVNHLSIPLSQGYFYGKPLVEKDFIKLLNYGK